jgi:ribosomal protein S5
VVRTDDIGRVNDPLYDHVIHDENGMVISGSGSQMKFVGGSPSAALDKLVSSKFQKYLDADAKIEVPSDFYDDIKKEAQEKIVSLEKQVRELDAQGKYDIAKQKSAEIEKYKKIDKNLQKSHVSNKEAVEARLHPELSTVKDIAGISHRAGVEAAKSGAVIGGSISLITNVVSVAKGDKEPKDAALDVVKDTGTGAVTSYTIAFAGSALKGAMQNASDKMIRVLSRTNLPAAIVTVTVETGKTLAKYISGEIDGVQCLEELGEKGTGMVASALFATIGQIAIPIPVVGGMIGGMLGYALSSACYGQLTTSLKAAKLAREERIRIEAECEEAIKMIRSYRLEMEANISRYLSDYMVSFQTAFDDIKNALQLGDIDGFIAGANSITRKLGGTPQFNTFDEFNVLMQSSIPFKL